MQQITNINIDYHKNLKKTLEENDITKIQINQKEIIYMVPISIINYKEIIYKYNRKLDMYRVGQIENFLEYQYKKNRELYNNAWTIVFSYINNTFHCIDGQHRLFALTNLSNIYLELKDHKILIMVRECDDEDEEDNFFMQLAKAEEIPNYLKEGTRPVRDLTAYILDKVYEKIENKENILVNVERCKVPNIKEKILKERIIELYIFLKKIHRFSNIDNKIEIINIVSNMINNFNQSLLNKYNTKEGYKELLQLFGKYSSRSIDNCYKKKSFISIPIFWEYFYINY